MALMTLTLLALTGCDKGGAWLDREALSCSQDPYDWFGGMSIYLDNGEVADEAVTFDWAPPQGYIANISGSYDAVSGDYSYTVIYSGYYLETDQVSGYGTIYHNGAVDLLHTVNRTDILGNSSSFQVREERYGCEGISDRYSVPQGTQGEAELLDATSYTIASGDRVNYTREEADGSGVTTGSWWSDLSHTYTEDYGDSWYADGTEYPNGDRAEEFSSKDDTYSYAGAVEYKANGRQIWDYVARRIGEMQVEFSVYKDINYNGTGSAVWTYDDRTCNVTYQLNGGCEYTCTDGDAGEC